MNDNENENKWYQRNFKIEKSNFPHTYIVQSRVDPKWLLVVQRTEAKLAQKNMSKRQSEEASTSKRT